MPTPAHTSKPTTQSGLVPLYASVDPDVKAALLTIAAGTWLVAGATGVLTYHALDAARLIAG